MANIKTAVSMQRSPFEELQGVAHQLDISRSRLISLAVEEFLRRHESRELMGRINAAFEKGPTHDELDLLRAMRRRQRRSLEAEW